MSSYLRGFPAFCDLSDSEVELLERILVVQTWQPGHVFVREGDLARGSTAEMFLILEGTVRVAAQAPEGGWGVHRTLGPGQFVGLLALLADVKRSATCTALDRVVAARLDRMTLEELFRLDVGVHARFQMVIARQLAADLRELGAMMSASMRTGDDAAVRARFSDVR